MNGKIKHLALAALGVCALSGSVVLYSAAVAAPDGGPEWRYEGARGPRYWGALSDEFSACSEGGQQSPIDITQPVDAELSDLEFDYQTSALNIENNGKTIQVNYEPGSTLTLDGQTYELLQFHFHDPSEHTVDGTSYPMEVHFVHQNVETGELAVVGVFLELDEEENSTLQPMWANLPTQAGPAADVADVVVDAAELLPGDTKTSFRYFGSLTTPPCSESVNWVVLRDPITVSSQQFADFVAVVGENARPVQPLGRRFVLD